MHQFTKSIAPAQMEVWDEASLPSWSIEQIAQEFSHYCRCAFEVFKEDANNWVVIGAEYYVAVTIAPDNSLIRNKAIALLEQQAGSDNLKYVGSSDQKVGYIAIKPSVAFEGNKCMVDISRGAPKSTR